MLSINVFSEVKTVKNALALSGPRFRSLQRSTRLLAGLREREGERNGGKMIGRDERGRDKEGRRGQGTGVAS